MKILVIDDHPLIREALRSALDEIGSEVDILEAPNAHRAMELVREHADLTLILLDLSLPDRDGFALLGDLRRNFPAVSVAVLSAYSDRDNVVKALDLGAVGFIPKSAQHEVMLSAMRLIFSGGVYIPPEILARHEAPLPSMGQGGPSVSPARLGLTGRQMDVLALMMHGKSNKAICRALNLAEPTVKNHVAAILKALKVANRTEAVIAVAALGWELPRVSNS
jgi:DNA-binding NarL/FixJ family response regulator